MQEQYFADRATLRQLLKQHPEYTRQQLAFALHRSLGWIKKWKKRLSTAEEDDEQVLCDRVAIRPQKPSVFSQEVVDRILDIRDHPPHNLHRQPGPKTILYYLELDKDLLPPPARLPRSTRTIWKILKQNHRLYEAPSTQSEPLTRPAPLSEWQMDFKDCTTVTVGLEGKRQHLVEVFNVVDSGTSILLEAVAREDFNATTVLGTLAQTFQNHGLPNSITLDRDPRFVGAATSRDFPSPLLRFLLSVGVQPNVCPPHRPDLNCYVERYHKSYTQECLKVFKPNDVEQVRSVTAEYKEHYNWERPHQGLACGNRPPRVVFAQLPVLPNLPLVINPDRWLCSIDGQHFVRKVHHNGTVLIDQRDYYLGKELIGKQVTLKVEAQPAQFAIYHQQKLVKRLDIKGLHHCELSFEDYLTLMQKEALAAQKRKT